ncbi:ABC transporter permease subunit [Cohnella sp. CFH 77786]|uniref:nickel ABC transporter permease n=1 Tax=Cohnella sp. CFH 77786 TaxID=2662265 RepID=UPI001C6085AE|nr:nickel ABC transporter permease [Cohnella sp. CFH 77786]MBW5446378.1 ABC transporter permease subunit [Cohnella sp. CFH 77786]
MVIILGKRLFQLIFVLFLLSAATFTMMKLAPGDPVRSLLRTDEFLTTQADEAKLRKELGFDLPIVVQYGEWMAGVMQLDLGKSYLTGKPVLDVMASRLPITAQLTGGALLVMLLITVPLGTAAALMPGRWPDHLGRALALIGASVPGFWLGLLLIYGFSYKLQLFPSMGKGGFFHMVLPCFTLGFSLAAVYARLLRNGLLESLSQHYIRAARARGVSERVILTRYAFRAALLPVVTMFGMSIGYLLGGAVVVETLFSWPGLGNMVMDAIFGRDYPVIQGYVLFTGAVVVMINLIVDLSYRAIDPRIRFGKGESA